MSVYIAIDLKSFYASVECVERGFDPLDTNLVVADKSRTDKTICLAISPSLKSYGLGGRARLFEVVQKVKDVNNQRRLKAPNHRLIGDSIFDSEVKRNNLLALNYFVATPRMAYYMKYSSQIYEIYLKYVSKEDIHVYSIDEVFIDATHYLNTYKMSAHELALKMIHDILDSTSITATCGIGTNLYLAKIAMDIVAKHMEPDKDGVRISELDELSYRKLLWNHKPLTDFWRIGKGISARLERNGMYTQGDIARMSITNEDLLYKIFGVNAELIIDHAWGYEPVTLDAIKSYVPMGKSISSGQVLKKPYPFDKARLIIKEMVDQLSLDLVEKSVVTDQIVLTVGYDNSNMKNYGGEIAYDPYGRPIPKMAHSSINIGEYTNASFLLLDKTLELFDRIVNPKLTIRRMYVVANHILYEKDVDTSIKDEQMNLFSDYEEIDRKKKQKAKAIEKERKMQEAIIKIKRKHGKNSILRLNNLEEGATAIERNGSIGGHKA